MIDQAPLSGEFESFGGHKSDNDSDNTRQCNIVDPRLNYPLPDRPAESVTASVGFNEEQSKIDEGETETIVGARFGCNDVANIHWNLLLGKPPFDHRCRQDGVSGCDAGRYDQRFQVCQVWENEPHDQSADEPSTGHDWDQKRKQRPPMMA